MRRWIAGGGPRAAAAPVDPATAGTVRGRVTLDGPVPPATTVRLDGDKTCATFAPGARRPTEQWVVGPEGGLANVFVHVTGGLDGRSFPVPQEPVVIDQQKCWYVPRVVGVRVGQPLQVLNSDPLLHNVRANSTVNEPFNQGQPVQGVRYSHTFSTAEVMVPMKCDVHAWMNAWVGVVNHPYFAVTGPDGDVLAARPAPGHLCHRGLARSRRHAVGHGDGDRARNGRSGPKLQGADDVSQHPAATGSTAVPAAERAPSVVADYVALTKPRLNMLVVMTTLVAYYVGRRAGAPLAELVHTVVGTTLVAAGASAHQPGVGARHGQADAAHPAPPAARCSPGRHAGDSASASVLDCGRAARAVACSSTCWRRWSPASRCSPTCSGTRRSSCAVRCRRSSARFPARCRR